MVISILGNFSFVLVIMLSGICCLSDELSRSSWNTDSLLICLPPLTSMMSFKGSDGKICCANKQNVTMLWQLVRFVSLISSKRLPLCCCENFLKPLLMPRHPPGAGSALLALAGASPAATSSPALLLTSSLLLLLYCFSCSPPPCFYCGA